MKEAVKDVSWIETSVLIHHYLMIIYVHTKKKYVQGFIFFTFWCHDWSEPKIAL